MCDWYQAVVDLQAKPQEAEYLALKVTATFMTEGLIQPIIQPYKENYYLEGYRTGPKFHIFFDSPDQFGTVETFARGWYSQYGVLALENATCSICGTQISSQNMDVLTELKQSFAEVGQKFCNINELGPVCCPICSAIIPAHQWLTVPHLGFSHLAFVFWNWPPFEECRLDLLDHIDRVLGHRTVLTYGHL